MNAINSVSEHNGLLYILSIYDNINNRYNIIYNRLCLSSVEMCAKRLCIHLLECRVSNYSDIIRFVRLYKKW